MKTPGSRAGQDGSKSRGVKSWSRGVKGGQAQEGPRAGVMDAFILFGVVGFTGTSATSREAGVTGASTAGGDLG